MDEKVAAISGEEMVLTLYAQWEKADYTVTFYDGDIPYGEDTPQKPQKVSSGGKVEKPEDPTKTGYTFDAWYKEFECQNAWKFDEDTVGDSDVDLYAKFTINKHSVIFAGNEPEGAGPATRVPETIENVDYGSTVEKPATDPELTGYKFLGWYKEIACENAWNFAGAETPDKTPDADVTLYAKWFNIDYEFKLTNASDSTKIFSNSVADSDPSSIPVTSTKTDPAGLTDTAWVIKSYKIGEADPVTVDGTSFTDKGGLTVAKNGNSLNVTALKRPGVLPGSHDFWLNQNPVRADYLDWSPADWSAKTSSAPIDLSKFNFKNETTGNPMSTANCYIIRHAGIYKIPLVYGNGVKNSTENTESYFPNTTGGSYRATRFVNHLGYGINSAFIENNDGCTAASCSIVWQDEAAVIKELKIVGSSAETYTKDNVRYLQFTVDNSKICQNNAVIAVKDSNGDVIWSWCIWTTNDPALLEDAISVTNHGGNVYNFFPICNIGYVEGVTYLARKRVLITLEQSESGKTTDIVVDQPIVIGQSSGNYYQFGRKDPMCRNATPASGVSTKVSTGPVTLDKGILNPDTFYNFGDGPSPTPYYDWCTSNYKVPGKSEPGWYNLWTGKKSEIGAFDQDSEMIKTIYDPSPVGYKVPASNAFTGFTVDGGTATDFSKINLSDYSNGYYFYTDSTKSDVILFPASGYRNSENSILTDVGGRGSYWSAVPANESSGNDLLFWSGAVGPVIAERRSNGQSVRPVLEY